MASYPSPLLSWPLAALFLSLVSIITSSPYLLPPLRSASLALHHAFRLRCFFITPPCLFLLLNGIIFGLTLTSGILQNSGGPDFYSDFLMRVESRQKQRLLDSSTKPSKPSKQLQRERPVRNQSKVEEVERVREAALPLKQESEIPALIHRKASQFRGLEIVRDAAIHGQSKPGEMKTARSDVVTPQQYRRIPRSQSLGSAASVVKEDHRLKERLCSSARIVFNETSSQEDLSDEDLKKRIEDFISNMNARIRSESLQANTEL